MHHTEEIIRYGSRVNVNGSNRIPNRPLRIGVQRWIQRDVGVTVGLHLGVIQPDCMTNLMQNRAAVRVRFATVTPRLYTIKYKVDDSWCEDVGGTK